MIVTTCKRCGRTGGSHTRACYAVPYPPTFLMRYDVDKRQYYGGTIHDNLVQSVAAAVKQLYVLTDGRARVEQRMMNLKEAREAQERTDTAAGPGWTWEIDNTNEAI